MPSPSQRQSTTFREGQQNRVDFEQHAKERYTWKPNSSAMKDSLHPKLAVAYENCVHLQLIVSQVLRLRRCTVTRGVILLQVCQSKTDPKKCGLHQAKAASWLAVAGQTVPDSVTGH